MVQKVNAIIYVKVKPTGSHKPMLMGYQKISRGPKSNVFAHCWA